MDNLFWLPARLVLLAAALTAGLAQAAPPARVEIEFEVTRNGSTMAEVVERLEHANGTYRLTETWKGRGIYALLGRIKRTSEGTVGAEGVRPREFSDERSGRDTARASFDWGGNTMTLRYKGKSRNEPIPPNAQDRLSFLLALVFSPPTAERNYHVVDGRGVSNHTYRPNGRERISTPAGSFDTVKVIKRNAGSGEVAEVWLAVDRGNLPVRILITEKDGTRLEQVTTRITEP
jgi:Protein of unknown function (DUF3108)